MPRCSSMPQWMVDMMLEELNERINNPSGVWADFNCLHRAWRAVRNSIILNGIFCIDDLPDEPQPEDYPDIEAATTITNCGLSNWSAPLFDGCYLTGEECS